MGSVPAGNGKWGHADLRGNLAEFVLDAFNESPAGQYHVGYVLKTCINCADLTTRIPDPANGGTYQARSIRGGHYDALYGLASYARSEGLNPTMHDFEVGARCGRLAP